MKTAILSFFLLVLSFSASALFAQPDAVLADTLMQQGRVYYRQNRLEEALAVFQRTLALRKKVFGPKDTTVALVYENMTLCVPPTRYWEGLKWYQACLQIWWEAGLRGVRWDRLHYRLGYFHYLHQHYYAALAQWAEVNAGPWRAPALAMMGRCWANQGQTVRAVQVWERAVQDLRWQWFPVLDSALLGEVYIQLGNAWNNLNDGERSRDYYEQAIPFVPPSQRAELWRCIGDNYADSRKFKQATDAFTQAATQLTEKEATSEAWALWYFSRGRAHRLAKDTAAAEVSLEKALTLARPQDEVWARTLVELGKISLAKGKAARAYGHFEQAHQWAVRAGLADLVLEAGYQWLRLLTKQERYAQAWKVWQQDRQWITEANEHSYPYTRLQIAAAELRYRQALRSKRARDQQAALDQIAVARAAVDSLLSLPRNLVATWDIEVDFATIHQWAVTLHLALGQPQAAFTATEAARRQAARRALPALGQATIPVSPTVPAIQVHLNPEQTLLAYYQLPDSLLLFAIGRNAFGHISLPIPTGSLRDEVVSFFQLCSADPNDLGYTDAQRDLLPAALAEVGHHLYQRLLGEAARRGWLRRDLLLITDGDVHYVAFQALLSTLPPAGAAYADFPFLTKTQRICYEQSAGHWLALQNSPFSAAPKTQLTLAPDFANWQGKLSPLKFNETEAAEVARQSAKATISRGKHATKSAFLTAFAQHRRLHLATHGVLYPQAPDSSFLAFTASDAAHLEDAKMYVREIQTLRTDAELVVLSACETGLGQQQVGEGLLSIGRAFQYAGARSVLSALWNVNDALTPILMRHFYQKLPHSPSKSAAWQAAILAYWQPEEAPTWRWWQKDPPRPDHWAHPFYWAGFALQGDDRVH